MNARLPLLAGLLVVQLLLIALFSVGGGSAESGDGLVALEAAAVTRIEIMDGEGASVVLTRNADGWLLDDGVRADDAKIAELLDKLAATGGLWPVAATASSQVRFEVAEDNFQRRLDLEVDGDPVRLFFGTSPGYRRVHARRDGTDEVFAVALANYELPAAGGDWLDTSQLATDAVSSISLDGAWTLSKGDEGWLLDSAAAADSATADSAAAANEEAAQRLADRLDGLRVLDSYSGDEAGLGEPRRLTLRDAGGELELTLRHRSEEDDYVLTSSRVAGAYTVAAYIAEQLLVEATSLQPAPPAALDQAVEGAASAQPVLEADADSAPDGG